MSTRQTEIRRATFAYFLRNMSREEAIQKCLWEISCRRNVMARRGGDASGMYRHDKTRLKFWAACYVFFTGAA